MKKFLLLLFLIFFFSNLAFSQTFSYNDSRFNQIFLKILSFIHKVNYFDQKLIRSKIIIDYPNKKAKFKPGDVISLRWRLETPEIITQTEANDPEYRIPYFWHIKLYNNYLSSVALKEETLPFLPIKNYTFSFKIPLSYQLSSFYFFKIELKNSFSNKTLKEISSDYFTIISFEEAKIKLDKYDGYLLKTPIKFLNKYEFLFFTSNEVFLVFSEKYDLSHFNNKFLKIEGKEIVSEIRNVKILEVLKVTPY